jgi:endonuclease YncB( thermonuclease family)
MKKSAVFLAVLLLAAQAPASGGFEADVVAVVDGDTFQFEAGLINVIIRGRCRMLRYNAPELAGAERAEGLRAKEKLGGLIGGKTVRVEAKGTDKYGRWLCEVWLPDGTNVNDIMREHLKDYMRRDMFENRWKTLPPLDTS